MFFLIGLGLGDPKDITVKGLEIIKKCSRVYLEAYTSILSCGTEALEEFYGRNLIVADRDLAEQGADEILEGAHELDIALLVVGDPFGATTHTDLVLRAKEKGIKVQVVHNASILNAVGCCGLQLYMFGETLPHYLSVMFILKIIFIGVTSDSLCIGLARVGSDTQKIVSCSLERMAEYDLGGPLHSLIIVGPNLHPLEVDYLEHFKNV
ncbi:diphthine synthase [Holotrichia oblita]|uniref:Diphthine synthase n=1 Tax=Holotrichia oblita TaxID=644536 RepID=A0ACB9TPA2_HOLOL|nr:diphthine synthase [Holotrichia oblita]